MSREEKEYYAPVKEKLEACFKEKSRDVYLEITGSGKFSEDIKGAIPQNREIIFSFLKKGNSPDITGFVPKNVGLNDFIVAEIKRELKLGDIYQTRKYVDLFDSEYSFLISLKKSPKK